MPGASEIEVAMSRIAALEHEVRELKRSKTNSPRFWPRSFAILGHVLVYVAIWFGVPIVIWMIAVLIGGGNEALVR
jgi:hypothetical protein